MMLISVALFMLILLAVLFPAFHRGTFLLFLILGVLAVGPILENPPTMILIVIALPMLVLLAILALPLTGHNIGSARRQTIKALNGLPGAVYRAPPRVSARHGLRTSRH
jgi:hypothetical protein